jgi:hypothetical protein
MRTLGLEIKSNEAILCMLASEDGVFELPDCRVQRIVLKSDDQEGMQDFHFKISKLVEDYKIEKIYIKERPKKGKFAGGALGFKIESAIQLVVSAEVVIMSAAMLKEGLKRSAHIIDFNETGLKKFMEPAFSVALASYHQPRADFWEMARVKSESKEDSKEENDL